MAGDWIKMRSELFTHPKFLSLCSELVYNEDRVGLLVYACGAESLGIDTENTSNETVTERALRRVTERALHDVTMSALMRVWCAVNAHCKVVESDAVMSPMSLLDLDGIAGFDGFGDAMREVGWANELEPNTLLFRNFLEFNEPACVRRAPKSNAERQRLFRERQRHLKGRIKDSASGVTKVTKVTKSNGREEKIREEKNSSNSPLPPGEISLPQTLDTPQFRVAWEQWAKHRSEIRKPLKPTTVKAQIRQLEEWGHDRAVAALDHSVANGYQGLFEPHANGSQNGKAATRGGSIRERLANIRAKEDACNGKSTTGGQSTTEPSSGSASRQS